MISPQTKPKKNTDYTLLELAVIHKLGVEGEFPSMELMKEINKTLKEFGRKRKVGYAKYYSLLNRLEQQGLIATRLEDTGKPEREGARAMICSLTGTGMNIFWRIMADDYYQVFQARKLWEDQQATKRNVIIVVSLLGGFVLWLIM